MTTETIASLFDRWSDNERRALVPMADDATTTGFLAQCFAIEKMAVTLPATTALDVWRLIRMTNDIRSDVPEVTADMLVHRAYAETGA